MSSDQCRLLEWHVCRRTVQQRPIQRVVFLGTKMNVKRILSFPMHPVLISAYPVLYIYSNNVSAIPVSQLPGPLLITIGLGILVWALAAGVQKSRTAGALTASLTMLMGLLYRYVWVAFTNLTEITVSERHAALTWCVVWLGLAFLIWKTRKACEIASQVANVFSLVLVAAALVSIAVGWTRTHHSGLRFAESAQRAANNEKVVRDVGAWNRVDKPTPDIYYVILDGYARHDWLRKNYGYDNEPFLQELRQRGFFVAERSTSNYPETTHSLSASLNMDYPHRPLDGPAGLTMQDSRAAALLRAFGYKYVVVPSGYSSTDASRQADVTIDLGITPKTELAALLYEWSFAPFLMPRPQSRQPDSEGLLMRVIDQAQLSHDLSGTRAWAQHVTDSIDAIGKLAAMPGPKFVFAHVVCPHPPYVFLRDGSLNPESSMGDLSGLRDFGRWFGSENVWTSPKMIDQIIHLNKLILEMVDQLRRHSAVPPVIIVQADHGTFALGHPGAIELPSYPLIQERMSILFACHAPEKTRSAMSHNISPVNLFRILFNTLFDAQYRLLPDRCYWILDDLDGGRTDSEVVQDVTDIAVSHDPP